MTKTEIVSAVQRLDQAERRQILQELLKLEEEGELLDQYNRLADERFQLLDQMEEEDGKTSSG